MKDNILVICKTAVFILCLALVIYGQKTVGKMNLGIMLLGLAGLLGLLYDYNRKFV